MKDELVSFKTAELAKEKRFDISPNHFYREIDGIVKVFEDYSDSTIFDTPAPTQSLLQRWLREKHGILVVPIYGYNDNPNWSVHIEVIELMKKDENSVLISGIDFQPTLFETYEDALETGLYESLKLIKS